ncbi:uncharacterized protein LOC112509075 [Cynara cardunculus var. scolymus]|uniref:uncharacterized protein LOC112509075 n=1 Tax=Cynara cardunculus var. scolymus TaxID=59895 RepID=UPI000D62E242|nr:uncharacterized protein LOC112509075 [Cynara cardunculus var. scolymus]
MEKKMMDTASGGAIANKTPTQARTLIDTMAENSKQFGVRSDVGRGSSEVHVKSLETKITDLTNLVKQLAMGNMPQVKACGFCSSVAHPIDACPDLHEEEEQVNAIRGGNFQNSNNRAPDPFSSTYNPSWRQHPNLSYAPRQGQGQGQQFQQRDSFQPLQQFQSQQFQAPPGFQQQNQLKAPFQPGAPHQHQVLLQAPSGSDMSLEDVVKSMAANMVKFQQKTQASIQDLQATAGQLANKGKFPSQMETYPKANVSAVTLRNGKKLQEVGRKKKEKVHEEEEELEVKTSTSGAKDVKEEEAKKKTPKVIVQAPAFPSRFEKTKQEIEEKEILDTFRKVQVNIPLLDAIKQVPRYAKFLKELCTNKRKLKGNEKISMSQNVSAVLALKPTGVVIQLADRSIVYPKGVFPKGVLEDVLVQVNELVFPAYFFVIDMEEKNAFKADMLLLGRPFLKTSKTKIDIHSGSLTMEFDVEMIKFNIYDAMRYPSDVSSLCFVDIIKPLSNTMFDLSNEDVLEVIIDRDSMNGSLKKLAQEYKLDDDFAELALELELKTLPDHLKYAYLGDKETLPVIISATLSPKEERELVDVLKEHKRAIGWTIADIKGLSPSLCQH